MWRWATLVILSFGAVIAYVDRMSMSSALAAGAFKLHFGLPDIGLGWVSSAFFWPYAVMQIPILFDDLNAFLSRRRARARAVDPWKTGRFCNAAPTEVGVMSSS
jgi:hypothetical protein